MASKLLRPHCWADYLARQERWVSRARLQGLRSHGRHLVWFNGRNLHEIRTADVETYATCPIWSWPWPQHPPRHPGHLEWPTFGADTLHSLASAWAKRFSV